MFRKFYNHGNECYSTVISAERSIRGNAPKSIWRRAAEGEAATFNVRTLAMRHLNCTSRFRYVFPVRRWTLTKTHCTGTYRVPSLDGGPLQKHTVQRHVQGPLFRRWTLTKTHCTEARTGSPLFNITVRVDAVIRVPPRSRPSSSTSSVSYAWVAYVRPPSPTAATDTARPVSQSGSTSSKFTRPRPPILSSVYGVCAARSQRPLR